MPRSLWPLSPRCILRSKIQVVLRLSESVLYQLVHTVSRSRLTAFSDQCWSGHAHLGYVGSLTARVHCLGAGDVLLVPVVRLSPTEPLLFRCSKATCPAALTLIHYIVTPPTTSTIPPPPPCVPCLARLLRRCHPRHDRATGDYVPLPWWLGAWGRGDPVSLCTPLHLVCIPLPVHRGPCITPGASRVAAWMVQGWLTAHAQ